MRRLLALGALVLAMASCGGGRLVRVRDRSSDDCSPGGPAIPLRSFGNDAQAFRVEREAAEGPKRYTYRFEREPSGTTETLRAVVMAYQDQVLAVGDRGTALLRDPARGWIPEATGTDANLYAIAIARIQSGGPVEPNAKGKPPTHVAVGARGAALVRTSDGVWHAEQTGTDRDLFAVSHQGVRTLAVGAGGTLVERSAEGVWRPLRTRTTADLYGIYGGTLVGAGGATVSCRWFEGEAVCIPQRTPVERDLHAVSEGGLYFGDGVLLAPVKGDDGALTLKPWGEDKGVAIPADDMRAVWINRFGDMGEHIAVGRAGAVWFVSNPFYRKNTFERVQLPFGVDLHGVAFELVDGFLVGDQGTIVHLAVDGIMIHAICLL